MVDGSEEGTSEIERALASAPERLFFRRLLFSAEMWRSFVFCVGFSDSISDQCELRQTIEGASGWQRFKSEIDVSLLSRSDNGRHSGDIGNQFWFSDLSQSENLQRG